MKELGLIIRNQDKVLKEVNVGILKYANGDVYSGYWEENEKAGYGTLNEYYRNT